MEVSAPLRVGNKVSKVANLIGVSRTTVYAINKHIDEDMNGRAGSG